MKRDALPKLFRVGLQEWIALDAIEAVDDYGWDIGVTLKSGKATRIPGNNRDAFLHVLEKMTE
jgi:hypothetical protein